MIEFANHVDSLDANSDFIVAALSSLDGDVWDGSIRMLSLNSGEEVMSLYSSSGVSVVRFFGAEKNIVVSGNDRGELTIIPLPNENERNVGSSKSAISVPAHDNIVSSLCSQPKSNSFLSACWNGDISLWDLNSLTSRSSPVSSVSFAHSGHINEIAVLSLNEIVSVGDDGFARLWDLRDLKSGQCSSIARVRNRGTAVCSVEGKFKMLIGSEIGDVSVFDLRCLDDKNGIHSSSEISREITSSRLHKSRVRRIVSQDCEVNSRNLFYSASDDASILRFEVSNSFDKLNEVTRVFSHSDYVTDLCISPNSYRKKVENEENEENEIVVFSSSTDKTIRQTSFSCI